MIRPHKRGFTLLLAALVASLVLSLGLSIFTISLKSVTLSTTGRDSQYAFYAADTGAECGLYWDARYDAFSTTSPRAQISCDNSDVANPNITVPAYTLPLGAWPPAQFAFQYEPNGYCVKVTVSKYNVNPRTQIHADGYSVTCANIATNARALQRSVELNY